MKQAFEFRLAPEYALLLVVDVQDVELSWALGEDQFPRTQKAAQNGRAKGIEKKNDARACRERELQSIATKHTRGCAAAPGCSPKGKILTRNARQSGMQLNAKHGTKRMSSGQQHRAAHTGTEIDECIFVDGGERAATAPAHDHSLKYRRSDCVIGCYVAIVAVPRAEMTASDQAARAHAKLKVEWMADQAVLLRQTGQAAPVRSDCFLSPSA